MTDRAVDAFIALVRQYLEAVDSCQAGTVREFLAACASVLPRVYAAGQELPDVELPERDTEWERSVRQSGVTKCRTRPCDATHVI